MRVLSLVLVALVATAPATSPAPGATKLNVLFMVVDDLNTDLGSYRASVQTPNT